MLVPAPLFVGACRACAWPPPWWGLLCRRVRVLVRGVIAGWLLGLFCWCAVVSAAVRPALSGVACLWCFPGRDGLAGLPSACGAPPLCPGRVGRAGLPSACGAPLLVFVSRVSSPCCSWSFARSCLCGSWPCAGVCRRLLLCPPPPPHPAPSLLGAPTGGPPPPFPGAMPFPAGCLALVYPCCLCALWLAVVGVSFCPPPPGRVSWVLAPAARFPLSSCFCLVFSVPLALAPVWLGFVFPPRHMLVPAPPPAGGCSWWSAVPRVLFCGAVVEGGLLCAACGVLLRRAVLLCGCLAVWCVRLLCRWPSPVGVGRALSVGVARCSASLRCFVGCFVVCGAVVRCRVLRCFPCCSVVSWLFSLCLSWFCAPAGLCRQVLPPPPRGLCVVPSAGLCCCGVLACSALCGAVLLLAVLCCSGCGVPCRVVPCPVVLRGWRGAALRFLVRLRPAACSAVLGGAVLCCRALRRSLGCCVLVLWAVLSRCVLLWVALCRLVSVGVVRLAACCAALLFAAVCCAAPLGVVSGCAVPCYPRCGLLFRFGRAALCCAVPPGAVLGRVALCCAVSCCAVLSCVAPFAGVLRPGALCCAVPLCAVVGCFVPSGVCWRCAVRCVLCRTVVCCRVLCCAFGRGVCLRCAVLSSLWLAVSFWSRCPLLCCAVPPGAVLGRVASCCAVWCCAAVHRAVGVALCCVVSRSVVPLPAVACPRLLCGASGVVCFAACCAVLLCFVLCLGVWCLGALCCAVRVVSGCLVGLCVPVCCAVSLGAVVLCVASCCFVRCSAVAHCAVCVVRCCFCSRCLVLVRAVSCPRVLCRAVGCCAVWCGALLWCPVLCALRSVCFAVVLWCVLFLLLSVVLLAPCGVTPVHFQKTGKTVSYFQKKKKLFPAGLPCVPCPPCMQKYHTLNKPACFFYLIPGLGLVCTAGLGLESCGCVLGVLDTVHLQQKGGQTLRGWGSSGRRRYMENKKGQEAASAGA